MDDENLRELTKTQENVFRNWVYRIPALFYERESKTLLAFAEQRKGADDHKAEHLVMSTGKLTDDSGKKTIEWSAHRVVKEAHLDGHRPMNPCPVYESEKERLFLFFSCVEGTTTEQKQIDSGKNKTRLCYITTEDLGQSWSKVTDLTDLKDKVKSDDRGQSGKKVKLPDIKKSAPIAVSPGHGLQTDKNRLIVPIYAYIEKVPYAFSLYSDDRGITWHFGKPFQNESLECEMAEFFDDKDTSSIYCNARTRKGGYRHEAVSENDGETFVSTTDNPPSNANRLVETSYGCQGSVISFPDQTSQDKTRRKNKWLLYIHPTNQCKRKKIGVYVNKSPQTPHSWSKPWIINSGPSAYSDVVYIDDGWFVCLMERGKKKYTEQIASVVFRYDQVKQGISTSQHHRRCPPCCIL